MENFEQEAEKYARKVWGDFYENTNPDIMTDNCLGELTKKDFIAGAEFATRWIPEAENKPKLLADTVDFAQLAGESERVFVIYDGMFTTGRYFHNIGRWSISSVIGHGVKPQFWMPIPVQK